MALSLASARYAPGLGLTVVINDSVSGLTGSVFVEERVVGLGVLMQDGEMVKRIITDTLAAANAIGQAQVLDAG